MTTYRYQQQGTNPAALQSSMPGGITIQRVSTGPYLFADVVTNAPLADRADLDGVMTQQGYTFVAEDPPTPEIPSSWLVPAWYIDPAAGDDTNDGTTSGTPLKTSAELVKRWGTTSPNLYQATEVNFLSDQPDLTDPVSISPNVVSSTGTFTLRGGLTAQAGASGTFTAVSVRNRSAGSAGRWRITDGSKPANFWAAYVGMLVHDTTADAWFWVTADLGGSAAEITEAMASAVGNPVPAYTPISNGDSYQVFALRKINLVLLNAQAASGNAPVIEHVWVTGTSFGSVTTGFAIMTECRTDVFWNQVDGVSMLNSANSYLFGLSPTGSTIVAGAITSEFAGVWGGENTIDGDCVVLAPALAIEGTVVVGAAYFANALSVPNLGSLGGSDGTLIVSSGALYGTAALWGPGSVDAHVGGDVQYTGTAVGAFLNTGGLSLDGQSTAFSVDLTSGAWTPGVNVTPANLDAAAPGGFGGIAYGVRGTKIRQVA